MPSNELRCEAVLCTGIYSIRDLTVQMLQDELASRTRCGRHGGGEALAISKLHQDSLVTQSLVDLHAPQKPTSSVFPAQLWQWNAGERQLVALKWRTCLQRECKATRASHQCTQRDVAHAPVFVDECVESEPVPPARREVAHVHVRVSRCLHLTPQQQSVLRRLGFRAVRLLDRDVLDLRVRTENIDSTWLFTRDEQIVHV